MANSLHNSVSDLGHYIVDGGAAKRLLKLSYKSLLKKDSVSEKQLERVAVKSAKAAVVVGIASLFLPVPFMIAVPASAIVWGARTLYRTDASRMVSDSHRHAQRA